MKKNTFLKAIRIQNFKSYKDLQEVGPCHPRLNIIIGPNGTGKSNFLDSIIFVLGKRAGKLRFKKISDTINFNNFLIDNFCGVSLIFKKDMRKFFQKKKIYLEIIISRQVFKNNLSVYYINGIEVSYLNLTKALKNISIGEKNERFLIQQGEIEKISMMKSKSKFSGEIGVLEFTEDIFGSSRYLKKLNKKKKKVIGVQTRQKSDNFIKSQEMSNFENSLGKKRLAFWRKIIVLTEIKFLRIRKKIQFLSWIIKRKEKLMKISLFLARKKKKKTTIYSKIIFLKRKIKQVQVIFFPKKKTEILFQNFFYFLKELLFYSKIEKSSVKEKRNCEKNINFQRNIFKMKLDLSIFFKVSKFFEKRFKNFFLKKIKKNKKTFFFFSTKNFFVCINQKNFIDSIYFTQIHRKKKEKTPNIYHKFGLTYFFPKNLWKGNCLLKTNIYFFFFSSKNFNQIRLKFFSKSLKTFLEIRRLCSAKIKSKFISSFFEKKIRKIKNSQQKHGKILKKSYEKKKFIIQLFNWNCLNENKENLNQILFFFLRKNQIDNLKSYPKIINKKFEIIEKNVPGIIGMLSSLGFIKVNYGIAFLSILGGFFNNILVDTYSNCSMGIKYIQKNKIGRTVFMIYEKLKSEEFLKNEQKLVNNIELFDLVYCRSKYKFLFQSILKDIILVKNLNEAINYSNSRKNFRRLVTLDGKQVEMSGILTGGGFSQNIGSFLNFKKRKNKQWVDKYQFYQIKSKNPKKDVFFNLLNFLDRSKFKIYIEKSKKLKKRFSLSLLKRYMQSSIYSNEQLFDKNKILYFKKKILQVEIGIFISRILCRSINSKFGKFLLVKLAEKNRKNIKLNLSPFKIPLGEIICSARSKFEKSRGFDKKIRSKILRKKIFLIKFLGRAIKRNHFYTKMVELLHLFLVIFLIKKKIQTEVSLFNLVNYTQLKNQKSFIFENLKKQEKMSDFKKRKNKIKLEIKITILFLKKIRILWNSVLFSIFEDEKKSIPQKLILIKKFQKESFSISRKFKRNVKISSFLITYCRINEKYFIFYFLKFFEKFQKLKIERAFSKKLIRKNQFFKKLIFSLHIQRCSEYLINFFSFDKNIKKIFPIVSKGGIMEINLIDFTDPFVQGVSLSIKPSEKTWKLISFLSGGEKTLSSLAVVFSVQELKPSPWYLMDEIDSALDFKNVGKISDYLFFQSNNAQILIVSLRNNILEKAHHLLGVLKIYGGTKITSIRN